MILCVSLLGAVFAVAIAIPKVSKFSQCNENNNSVLQFTFGLMNRLIAVLCIRLSPTVLEERGVILLMSCIVITSVEAL